MSAKSRQSTGRKVSLATNPPPPRVLNQIEEDYGRLVAQAGQAQYNIHIYTEDLKRINEGLKNLNYEAAARKNLDSKQTVEIPPIENQGVSNES